MRAGVQRKKRTAKMEQTKSAAGLEMKMRARVQRKKRTAGMEKLEILLSNTTAKQTPRKLDLLLGGLFRIQMVPLTPAAFFAPSPSH